MSCRWHSLCQEETEGSQQDSGDFSKVRSDLRLLSCFFSPSFPHAVPADHFTDAAWGAKRLCGDFGHWKSAAGYLRRSLAGREGLWGTLQGCRMVDGLGTLEDSFYGTLQLHSLFQFNVAYGDLSCAVLLGTWFPENRSNGLWTGLPTSFNSKHSLNFANLLNFTVGHFSLKISTKSSLLESPMKVGWPLLGM